MGVNDTESLNNVRESINKNIINLKIVLISPNSDASSGYTEAEAAVADYTRPDAKDEVTPAGKTLTPAYPRSRCGPAGGGWL